MFILIGEMEVCIPLPYVIGLNLFYPKICQRGRLLGICIGCIIAKTKTNLIEIWQVYQNYRSSNKYRSTRTVLISIIASTLFVRMSKGYFVCPRQ